MGIKIDRSAREKNRIRNMNAYSVNSLLQTEIKLGSGFNDKARERFYHELSTLMSAGVTVRSALQMIEDGSNKTIYIDLVKGVKDKLVQGSSFSNAMEQSGKFSPYEYYSIQIGEESGNLIKVLNELYRYYNRKVKLKRQLIGVLSYPAFVFAVALGVVFFMMNNIVPMFTSVFVRYEGTLPELTQVVISISEWVQEYFYYGFFSLVILLMVFFFQRRAMWFRKYASLIQFGIPIIGSAIKRVYLARFCQAMQLLIGARTPLLKAVWLVQNMIGSFPFEKALERVENDISKGIPLHVAMAKHPLFDNRMISLLKAAEEVNQMDVMFQKLSEQYSEEIEHQTNIIGAVLEPFIILFIAGFVGVILIAMYLPLFSLSTTIG